MTGSRSEPPFVLDRFQLEAIAHIDRGRSVLVAAPTGSGKTMIAQHAIDRSRLAGRRTVYTTPLKALSNQKFREFCERYGPASVGLLTGDRSIRPGASVVVMTTEVLRNMIYAGTPLDDIDWVVLDEVHYLQDRSRGAVWEEVIVHLPATIGLVCLSATVSNADEVGDWLSAVRGTTAVVVEERRSVELVNLYAVDDRASDELVIMPTLLDRDGRTVPNPDGARYDRTPRRRGGRRIATPWRIDVADHLAGHSQLPAIFFVFSRAGCDDAVSQCVEASLTLTDETERVAIDAIADRHTAMLDGAELSALDHDSWREALRRGIAAHHAGVVPPMKEAIEEAFGGGLVKIVFATETLALGVNMPARSVVIERLTKFTGERHEMLTPGEYAQLTGRAGRRGLDEIGYAVVCWSPFVSFEEVAGLALRPSAPLRSSFRVGYNMAVNLVKRHPEAEVHTLLGQSFAQYQADRGVTQLERDLERERSRLDRLRRAAADGPGDIADYRARVAELDEATDTALASTRPDALRAGDVLATADDRYIVILRPGAPKGRATATDVRAAALKLGRHDLVGAVRCGQVDLPTPVRPARAEYRIEAARRLESVLVRGVHVDRHPAGDRLTQLRSEIAEHPCSRDPRLKRRLDASRDETRCAARVAKLARRIERRGDGLVRQFGRVLTVLRSWGYVDDWTVTDAGRLLAATYAESELLLAEAVRIGLFDELAAAEVAALASLFTYQRRGPDVDEADAVLRWPTPRLAERAREVAKLHRDLALAESDHGLPESREPDTGLVAAVFDWSRGVELGRILEEEETSGGDFVRNIKLVIDILDQLGDRAPSRATADRAREASGLCRRGVVAASGVEM